MNNFDLIKELKYTTNSFSGPFYFYTDPFFDFWQTLMFCEL